MQVLQQGIVPAGLSVRVEQHKMERVVGSIAVTQALKAAISELHPNVPMACSITLSVTCTTTWGRCVGRVAINPQT
jgi:hypothetical protein